VLKGKSDKGPPKRRTEEIVKVDPSQENLPDRVFVVQFRDPIEPRLARFAGRAEHVMSGQNAGFKTSEELVEFFGRVMRVNSSRDHKKV
jgi:hypothetical protein